MTPDDGQREVDDVVRHARADERQRIVERLLHAANVIGPDEVSRTAITLEKAAMIVVAEGDPVTNLGSIA